MNIIIMHQTVTNHDAIGNDIEAMYILLSEKCDCFVYAENCMNKNVKYINHKSLLSVLENKDSVIIYHHSVYWAKGEELLKRARGRIIFRYHNITPAEFFEPYNRDYYEQCQKGREQTVRYVNDYKDAFWMAASCYNMEDLPDIPKEKIAVCPPFHKIETWAQASPDEKILKRLIESNALNVLVVGRIVPNKGHGFLLEVLETFKRAYDIKIRLHVIGKFDPSLSKYNEEIKSYMKAHDLEDSVSLIGEINDETLLAYYLGADFLLCASEHEGFCVPLIEAGYFGLPVIALHACAVPETLGNNQVVLKKEQQEFAAAVRILCDNTAYQDYLIAEGKKNYQDRFSFEVIKQTFITAFAKGTGIKI